MTVTSGEWRWEDRNERKNVYENIVLPIILRNIYRKPTKITGETTKNNK